jgi:hypothetical protein
MKGKSKKKPLRIIMDTNAFFVPFQFRLDIFEELKKLLDRNFEPVVLHQTLKELEKLASSGPPKICRQAMSALKLAKKCREVKVTLNFQGSHDDLVLEIAKKWKCPVFTNDSVLRKRLRDINVPVIYLRQKTRLEIEGSV